MNMYLQKLKRLAKNYLTLEHTELLNSDHEQVYLFYFVSSLEKTTKYNLGGNRLLK